MKKIYLSPQVKKYGVLPAQVLAASVRVGAKTQSIDYDSNSGNDAFWSKNFGGSVFDDADSGSANE